jgi:deoxyadenosine/deoxycytidine kinase
MLRWSFNLQIYFLTSRFKQIIDIRNSGVDVVQDRTIYEDSYIFASNLYEMGLMSTRDYENYQSLFELMSSYMQAPDLLIYLRADIPTLVRQIAKRNRAYEQSIRLDYLKALNEKYENWIANYDKGKVLIIESDKLEFENPEDLSKVIDSINASLNGLF